MNKFKICSLAIIFLLSTFRCHGHQNNFIGYLREHHDTHLVKQYRRLEDLNKKAVKTEQDIIFLKKCKIYNAIPKFLRFKLYKKTLNSSSFYRSWQIKLLDNELSEKNKAASKLKSSVSDQSKFLTSRLNILENSLARSCIQRNMAKYRETVQKTHERKLTNLSVYNNLDPCNPDTVVHNYSSVHIPFKLKNLLAFGLDFKLPSFKVEFHQFFFPLEKLASCLSNEKCAPGLSAKQFYEKLQFLGKKYFYEFNPAKVFSPIFNKHDIHDLREFGKRSDIFVSSPDKGNGVVVVDRSSYLKSMYGVVNDNSKFRIITEPIHLFSIHVEDKINKFLLSMKKSDCIDEATYKTLHATGTGSGILYGKPKVHKPDFSTQYQFRPILAAYNQASYKIAKFIVPILSCLTNNQYTVKNSTEFTTKIHEIQDPGTLYMASFDVDSLFTNIPLRETIDICVESLFMGCSEVSGFNRDNFRKLLELASMNSFFMFDNKYYQQMEGLGMGNPLSSTFANAFMCHHETTWMNECPPSFKPVHYFRYIDDTLLLFHNKDQCMKFFEYLNNKHPSIKFTVEHEQNDTLNFLDVKLQRNGIKFSSSVHRKPTFTGLGTSFFSFCCNRFKINVIQTLLNRAYNICSSALSFQQEITFLKNFFFNNGYPKTLVENQTENFMSKKLDFMPAVTTVNRKPFFYKLQYYGHKSVLFNIEVSKLISQFYYHLNPTGVLVNNLSIGSFFKCKDQLPKSLRSCVIYKYSCPQSNCGSEYIGSTIRTLGTRANEHRGTSIRTGRPLSKPSQSSIRDHCVQCAGDVSLDCFKIIGQLRGCLDYELRLSESIFIHCQKPKLNDMNSAFPLKIVK